LKKNLCLLANNLCYLLEKDKLDSIKLATDILYFPGHANIISFKLGTTVIISDTGRNIKDARSIRSEIESYFGRKITHVIITHFHSDHTHSLPLYADCVVIASEQTKKFLARAKRKQIEGLPIVSPTIAFKDQYIIEEGNNKVLIKKTGGHTSDSSFIYSPGHKLLIAGDNLRSDFLWGGKEGNPEKWLCAFEEYLSLDTTFIISGHGEIITRDQLEVLVSLIKEMKALTLTLNEKKMSEIEIITQLNNIQPLKETSIFVHDSTVTKWARFWSELPLI
jgi:glyoxylase-like metal-dependent hydrolase (beta-lactamase superfamily II)